MTFVNGIQLPALGTGACFALWAFRALASGCKGCQVLFGGFEEMLGELGAPALDDMLCFTKALGTDGARRIVLAPAGCSQVTADELSIVAIFASAQQGDYAQCRAHLNWLMGGKNMQTAFVEACRLGTLFSEAGLEISNPDIELTPPSKVFEAPMMGIVGTA